jgi:hypothetical protein
MFIDIVNVERLDLKTLHFIGNHVEPPFYDLLCGLFNPLRFLRSTNQGLDLLVALNEANVPLFTDSSQDVFGA